MYDVLLLTLASEREGAAGCGSGGCCGAASDAVDPGPDDHSAEGDCASRDDCAVPDGDDARGGEALRVPVLACADALTAAGARVTTVTARSDADIDAALAGLDGPPRPDGLTWPDAGGRTRLVVATASDAQLRAVVRRMVRRYAPPPSRRPADLADNRTLPELPPIGVLPLDPARSTTGAPTDLAGQLGLPRDPAEVARVVLAGRVRRLDLLRHDGGSITLDGALLGGADDDGRPRPWRGRVEVDDALLSAGEDQLLACVVGNGRGYAEIEGIPLLTDADPTDGTVEVAVAVPVVERSLFGRRRVRVEVRRARGRAVAVLPRDGSVRYLDDGVAGELTRKRSWWVEPGAWAVYAG